MGTDCVPLIADLFLFSFELDFMKNLIHTDFSVARKFNKTFRFIDDLLTLLHNKMYACALIHSHGWSQVSVQY